jgi:hypothetical protein
MHEKKFRLTPPRVVLAVIVLLFTATIPALAGHEPSGVQSATGCITSRHKLTKVALGDVPSSPCALDQTQVHLAGGDITAVTAGTGLTGGGTNGAVTLNASLILRQGPTVAVPPNSSVTTFAGCTDAENAIAGGFRWDVPSLGTFIEMADASFRADGTAGSWRVDGGNTTAATRQLTARVLCMKK